MKSPSTDGEPVKILRRKGNGLSSPALSDAMANLQKVMEAQSDWVRSAEKDILTLEQLLTKSGAPTFVSKAHGIAWDKWSKGRKRLVFCDDENLGPIVEGTAAQMMDCFQKLPDFVTALGEHVQALLSEEPLASIVVKPLEVIRIGNEVRSQDEKAESGTDHASRWQKSHGRGHA